MQQSMMLLAMASLAFAGCLDNDPTGPALDDVAALDAALTPTPFVWDGSVGHQGAACAAVDCVGYGYGDWDQSTDLTGITSGDFTLSWDNDLNGGLTIGLAESCSDTGPCEFDDGAIASGDNGDSPITLQVEDLDPDHTYTLIVWHSYQCAVNCMVGSQSGQQTAFLVEGTLLHEADLANVDA